MQHITLEFEKNGIIQASLVVVLETIKWPVHMVEGDHHLRKIPQPYPPIQKSTLIEEEKLVVADF